MESKTYIRREIIEHIHKTIDEMPPFFKVLNLGSKGYVVQSPDKSIDITLCEKGGGVRIDCIFINGNKYRALVYNDKHYKQVLKEIRYKLIDSIIK